MKRQTKFQVLGSFDGVSRATLTIDRVAQLVTVRPLRRHKTYTLPLSEVAEHILWKVARLEATEANKVKVRVKRKPRIKRGLNF